MPYLSEEKKCSNQDIVKWELVGNLAPTIKESTIYATTIMILTWGSSS